jgi:HemY protein
MKRGFLILVAIALALFAAAIAPVFKSDPGLVRLHFLGWTVETTLLVLVFAILLVWFLVWLAVRMWKMPAETARRMREQRSLRQLEKGLLALTEGDWVTAERALEKSASAHGRTTARYLAAAEAADGQDASDRAEWYLEQADTRNRKQKFLVDLTRARILVSNGQYAEAQPVLESLLKSRRKHPQVLELLARVYDETGDWASLQKILPVMLKTGVVTEDRVQEMKQHAAISSLEKSRNGESLKSSWQELPKAIQSSPEVLLAYAEKAIALGGPGLTEEVLRRALNREWNSVLLIPYGEPGPDDTSRRLKQCEKWLQEHEDDHWLQLALGRLCAREELWGKARHHMIRSLEIEPTVAGYDSLGQLLERKGELETAMACFRNALRMNQGKDPLPLPGDQARLGAPAGTGATPMENNTEAPAQP